MVALKPFSAVRPESQYAEQLVSVPYDVLNTSEARTLAANNPYSFLRITRSELELSESIDPYSSEVYEHAKKNYLKFKREQILVKDAVPSLYIYRLEMSAHVQTGIMGGVSVKDYDAGRIKIHEKTRIEKERDRTRHILTLQTHCEPALLAFKDQGDTIARLIAAETKDAALYSFETPDKIRHSIWRARDAAPLVKAFAALENLYIADGHHRSASASAVARELRSASSPVDAPFEYFLAVSFPEKELQIFPYNRVIKTSALSAEAILKKIKATCDVIETTVATPQKSGEFCLYLAGRWHLVRPRTDNGSKDPVAALDVSVLADLILQPVFDIVDQRTDKNIDFVGGIRGTAELTRLVDSGKAICAFSMFPVTIQQLFTIADAGLEMAPKSTWFEPKLRSGFATYEFGESN